MLLVEKRGGGPGRDRTCDLGIKSPLLYRLSYRPREREYRSANVGYRASHRKRSRALPERSLSAAQPQGGVKEGAHGEPWVHPCSKSPLLYRLSYRPEKASVSAVFAARLSARPPSTSGPGHSPFKAVARVRIPLGAPVRAVSSVGRAPALQAGGRWFEPGTAHAERPWKQGLSVVRVGAVSPVEELSGTLLGTAGPRSAHRGRSSNRSGRRVVP
jgi:hypothetical protein